eukprot:4271930-Pyramimonas_sp.AAC.1
MALPLRIRPRIGFARLLHSGADQSEWYLSLRSIEQRVLSTSLIFGKFFNASEGQSATLPRDVYENGPTIYKVATKVTSAAFRENDIGGIQVGRQCKGNNFDPISSQRYFGSVALNVQVDPRGQGDARERQHHLGTPWSKAGFVTRALVILPDQR